MGKYLQRSIAKPTDFHGKRSEDAEEWLDRFIRIALANNWTDVRKLQIVPIYLKDAAQRWFVANIHPNRVHNPTQWTGNAQSFTTLFLEKFVNETKKAAWQSQFDALK